MAQFILSAARQMTNNKERSWEERLAFQGLLETLGICNNPDHAAMKNGLGIAGPHGCPVCGWQFQDLVLRAYIRDLLREAIEEAMEVADMNSDILGTPELTKEEARMNPWDIPGYRRSKVAQNLKQLKAKYLGEDGEVKAAVTTKVPVNPPPIPNPNMPIATVPYG